jgi:phenylacetic acid degradation operon negative regulatory protein
MISTLVAQTGSVHARSALFDLYGDQLRARGSQAPVSVLVRLLAPLDITAPAVPTAISRMVRQGWLAPVRLAGGRGYTLTPRAGQRLGEAAERIYQRRDQHWDGCWHVVIVERLRARARRERTRAGLCYLGYAPLTETTWISPRAPVELDALLAAERLRAELFHAGYAGDPCGLVARAWDLDGLAGPTAAGWPVRATSSPRPGQRPATRPYSRCGAPWSTSGASSCSPIPGCRRRCCHLPGRAMTRPGCSGAESARLWPAASRFVDCCLRAEQPEAAPLATGRD